MFRIISFPLRVYLGGVFLFACFHKILNPGDFALDIASYQLLPLGLVNISAVTLPWVELAAGLGLVLGWRCRENSLLVAGMLLMFIVSISFALSQELQIGCGCFESAEAEEEMTLATLGRDLIWLVMAVYLFFFEDGKWGLDGLIRRKREAD